MDVSLAAARTSFSNGGYFGLVVFQSRIYTGIEAPCPESVTGPGRSIANVAHPSGIGFVQIF